MLGISGTALGIGLLTMIIYRKTIMAKIESAVWDIHSERRINTLHPKIRNRVRAFINEAERQGIKLRVTSGYRTWDEQTRLYNQGRTLPGSIVTNAEAGESWHNYALAFDVVEIKNGRALWNNANWSKIGKLGKSFRFSWGGDWRSFVDKPHFQDDFGYSMAALRQKYLSNQMTNGYIDLA